MALSNRSKLIKNASLMLLLKGSDYLLPLLVFPFLVHTLGIEKFGLLAFARAIIQYFIILTDYGFNFTGTRQIAINRGDSQKISQIFTTIITVKLLLLVISGTILGIAVLIFPRLREEWLIYSFNFLLVIGNIFLPVWFFQGMEAMGYITLFSMIAKISTSLLIFLCIRQPQDYQIAALIQSLGFFTPGLLSIFVIKSRFHIRLSSVSVKDVLEQLKDSGKVCIGSLLGNVMLQGGVIIIGLVSGNASAGVFSVAQRIAATLVSLVQPLEQVIYPHLCALYVDEYEKYLAFRNKIIVMGVPITILLSLSIFSAAHLIGSLIETSDKELLILIIRIFSFTIVFTIFNVLLNSFILSMNKLREMSSTYLYSSALFLSVSLPLTFAFASLGMAISFLIVESFICVRSFSLVFKPKSN